MNDQNSTPPLWAERLLSVFCKKEVFEIVQGDLYELYVRNEKKLGSKKAKRLYIRDVLTTIRPTLLKKLEGNNQLNQYGMFKNHLKTSARNLGRHPLFSILNTLGLAISMTVGIMMITFLSELHDVDDFHTKKDNIYRVTTTQPGLMGNQMDHLATSSYFIADQASTQLPEIKDVVVMSWGFKTEVKTDASHVALSGFYTTPSFFDVLSYPLLHGNTETAMSNSLSVILTVSAAEKLFPGDDPVGKSIEVKGLSGSAKRLVTGIVQDPPNNSYLKFDLLVPMEANPMINTDFRNNPNNTFENYVYLLLHDHADPSLVELKIQGLLDKHPYDLSSVSHTLEPMGTFVTGASMNANGPTFSSKKIDLMIALTLIALLSACFNYTNLSLGRSLRRLKEISIRKVNGATPYHLFMQFIVEAILISFLALLLGLGLFLLTKPAILDQVNHILNNHPIFLMELTYLHLGYFLLFTISIGLIAGFVPAWVLSRLKANLLMNDAGKVKLLSGLNARKALITFQFSLSIGLIMCAVMVYQQYKFAINFDLGYETENIINVQVEGNYMAVLEQEYATLPQVLATTSSQLVLGLRGGQFGSVISENFEDTTRFSSNYVGLNYFDVHDFEWLAGSDFSSSDQNDQVIVNEQFLKSLNIGTPEAVIGKKVRLRDDENTIFRIQGVVSDFMGTSLDFQMPRPFVFFQIPAGQPGTLGLKIATDDLSGTMTELEKQYQKHDGLHPFNARFYDDQLSSNYQQLKSSFTIISFLAVIAITISTLGLIGIAVYTVESRMKEVSIRKVLGADTRSLVTLLSRGFSVMIAIAGIIAVPVSLYVVDEMLLQSFFHRIEIGILEVASGFLIVLLIAVLTIGTQVRRVTVQKPADLLRDE